MQLENGNLYCWQWDTKQRLIIEEIDESLNNYIYIGNPKDKVGLYKMEIYDESGTLYCDIPDEILQFAGTANIYLSEVSADKINTTAFWRFTIKEREKPMDYVFYPTEQITIQMIKDELEETKNKVSSETIQEEIHKYFVDNPVSEQELDPIATKAIEKHNVDSNAHTNLKNSIKTNSDAISGIKNGRTINSFGALEDHLEELDNSIIEQIEGSNSHIILNLDQLELSPYEIFSGAAIPITDWQVQTLTQAAREVKTIYLFWSNDSSQDIYLPFTVQGVDLNNQFLRFTYSNSNVYNANEYPSAGVAVCSIEVDGINKTIVGSFNDVEYLCTQSYVDDKIAEIPAQAQANQNQNDKTAPDYIKNRTHWVDYEVGTATFDGDITGKTILDGKLFGYDYDVIYVKILDRPIAINEVESIAIYGKLANDEEHEENYNKDLMLFNNFNVNNVNIFTVSVSELECELITSIQETFTYNGQTVEQGTYVFNAVLNNNTLYVSKINGVLLESAIHKLDEKYLPDVTWDYVGIKKEELFNDTLTGFVAADGVLEFETAPFPLVVGLKYDVVWDGVSYNVECIEYMNHIIIGKYVNNQTENYPFGISYANGAIRIAARHQDGTLDWETDSHSVIITVHDVKQVPVKYIPEHTHSDLAAAEHTHSWDELTDRPVNIEYAPTSDSKTVVASASVRQISFAPPIGYTINKRRYIHDGAILDIYFNDELYHSISFEDDWPDVLETITYKIDETYGSLTCKGALDRKTGVYAARIDIPPFAEDTVVTVTYKYPVVTFKDEFIPDNIARKSYVDQQIAAIPKVELVQPDWNVNDETSGAYIKNRPFYEEGGLKSLTSFTADLTGDVSTGTDNYGNRIYIVEIGEGFSVDLNKTYTVKDNGNEYVLKPVYEHMYDFHLLGDTALASNNVENYNENTPFCIQNNYGWITFRSKDAIVHNIEVYVDDSVIRQIDTKFIPDEVRSDWNQNDPTAINYIENRPFYEKEADVELSFEAEIDIPDNGEGTYFHYTKYDQTINGDPIVIDSLYRVVYDGVEYNNVSVYENYGYRMLGFRHDSDDSIYPFHIAHRYDDINQVSFGATTPGLHIYQVYKILSSSELVQLDEKFIPETIARKSDIPTELPSVTSSDRGKFLRVSVDGTWVAETIPNAEEARF